MSSRHEQRVAAICTRSNGVQPLRQVSAVEDGMMKRRCYVWRLSPERAKLFERLDLLDGRPNANGNILYVIPTATGRSYVELCREAARRSNLSWPADPYGDLLDTGYVTWQLEWLERRERFRAALLELGEP